MAKKVEKAGDGASQVAKTPIWPIQNDCSELEPPTLLQSDCETKCLRRRMFSDLAKNIRLLQEQRPTNLRTMINLGSEVYGHAEVPDATIIFVDIGLGFSVEFTLDEALGFIPTKEAMLRKQVEQHTAEIAKIKAQSKLVVGGIQELLNITD